MIEFYSFETELITKLQTRGLAMQNHGVCYPWFSLLLFFCYNTIPAFMHTTMSTSPPALLFVKPGVRLNNTSKKIIQSFTRSGIPRSASFPARVLFQTSLSLVSPYCCHLYQADTQFRKPLLNGGKDFLIHKWLITLLQMVICCFRPYVFIGTIKCTYFIFSE